MDLNISELMHAHPLLTVVVFTLVVVALFAWALVAGADPEVENPQTGGDWAWPDRELPTRTRAAVHEAIGRREVRATELRRAK